MKLRNIRWRMISLEESYYLIMKETLKYCPKPSDALIVASMKRASITDILSEDSDFDKVPVNNRRWLNP